MSPVNWLFDIACSVILLPPYCSADHHITSVMKAFLTSEELRSIPYKSGQSLMVRMCTLENANKAKYLYIISTLSIAHTFTMIISGLP